MDTKIFRVDDISGNTNFDSLSKMIECLMRSFPQAQILFAISLLCADADGSVYPGTPFKDNDTKFFYNVSKIIRLPDHHNQVASHGLVHIDHSKLGYDAQEMSIITSCQLLKTTKFVAPFNKYNHVTEQICKDNDIDLLNAKHKWLSMECNKFDVAHNFWYFHAWRWTPELFEEYLLS